MAQSTIRDERVAVVAANKNDPVAMCRPHKPMSDGALTWCEKCGVVLSEEGAAVDHSESAIARASSDTHYVADGINNINKGTEHRYRSSFSKGAGIELANPYAKDCDGKRVKAPVISEGMGYHIGNSIDFNGNWFWDDTKGRYVFRVDYGGDKWIEMVTSKVHQEVAKQRKPLTTVEIGNVAIVAKQVYSRLFLGAGVDVAAAMTMLNANLVSLSDEEKAGYESKLNQAVMAMAKEVATRCGAIKDESEPPKKQTRKAGAIKVKVVS